MPENPEPISFAELIIRQIFNPNINQARKIQDGLDRFKIWIEGHRPGIEECIKNIEKINRIDWAEASRRLDSMPELSKKSMTLLLPMGWFLGWVDSLSELLPLLESLDGIDAKKVDDVMSKYYRENLDFIEKELTQRHQSRSDAIKAAFIAHRTLGDAGYFLSIPVFIAQADGLLSEILKISSPLSTSKKTKEIKCAIALRPAIINDQELSDLLLPFFALHDSDFLKSQAARDKEVIQSGLAFTGLNRHQVLHGECSNYGSEINSLKALSFLTFVGLHLPMMLENKKISL
ncbi:hypothetical protein [Janthinobacterium svalbardensis]|uniref:hypothetical protein n=1 Tax=Janthinobacterium svalbardensis TaxID=368607 RepID=UPI002FCDA5BA